MQFSTVYSLANKLSSTPCISNPHKVGIKTFEHNLFNRKLNFLFGKIYIQADTNAKYNLFPPQNIIHKIPCTLELFFHIKLCHEVTHVRTDQPEMRNDQSSLTYTSNINQCHALENNE